MEKEVLNMGDVPIWLGHMECDSSIETTSGCFWPMVLAPYSSRPIYCTHYWHIGTATNQPIPSFLTNTTTLPQAVWPYSSGCSLRGPLTCATSIHQSPPCWLAPPKRPTSSVLASNNRERSQIAQPWTSLCIAASNGSSFLATHRGNDYALWACHLMMGLY